MARACFEDPNNTYRYVLCCGDGLCLSRAQLISSVHKLTRQAATPELCFLIRAFFDAVLSLPDSSRSSASCKGAITNFVNRFALSLFEEGVILHASKDTKKSMCSNLCSAARFHAIRDYANLAAALQAVARLAHSIHRGRVGSLVMSYSKHGRPLPDDPEECKLIADMRPEVVEKNATIGAFAGVVKKTLPEMHFATLLSPYKNCEEFRRVCVMSAACAPFVREEWKATTPISAAPIDDERAPSWQFLRDIGALDDIHVKGRHDFDNWKVFLERGMKVSNETPMRIFGLSYSELEALYVEGKIMEYQAKSGEGGRSIGSESAERPAKRQMVAEPSRELVVARAEACFESERDVLLLTDCSHLLGFKNGTVVGELRQSVGSLSAGERVFFKMGESHADCTFAADCAKMQEQVGLPFVHTEVIWVKPSLDWWRGVPNNPNSKKDWSASMLKCLAARVGREMNKFGYMPCVIAKSFEGERLTDMHRPRDQQVFGTMLAKTLLFAKYVGIKDVGPFNMLISKQGEILIVDAGRPSAQQLSQYDAKGLYTSHSFIRAHKIAVDEALTKRREDLAAFLDRLQQLPRASNGAAEFWDKVFHREQ